MTRRYLLAALAALVGLPLVPGPVKADQGCEWLAGDLHVHTTYSHDSYGGPGDDNTGPEEFYTLGHTVSSQFALASARGLDYTIISDHNDVRSQSDPGFGSMGVIGLGGYENSLNGHAQMLGAHEVYDNGDDGAAAVQALADRLRADGGAFQINHPGDGDWALGTAVVPDSVEVWNISPLYQPPFPSASDNADAIDMWESFLDAGERVAATGGSDNHYLATSGVQGVGQPTTWVCAPTNDEAGIVAGIRAGRTFISHQPPAHQGPQLFLEGDPDGDGIFDALVGDRVSPDSELRVRVIGAPGSFLRLFADGGAPLGEPIPVTSPDFTHGFIAPQGSTWVRADIVEPDLAAERAALCDGIVGAETTYCRNEVALLAMTSAIFLGTDSEPAATTLTWAGDTRGRGETVDLAARLTDENGAPLPGETIRFTTRDGTVSATTGPDGIARTTTSLPGHGKEQVVGADYDGSASYLPSSVTATITWGAEPPGPTKESR